MSRVTVEMIAGRRWQVLLYGIEKFTVGNEIGHGHFHHPVHLPVKF